MAMAAETPCLSSPLQALLANGLKNIGPQFGEINWYPMTADDPLWPHTDPTGGIVVPAIAAESSAYDPVAAAVLDHSNFMREPWMRQERTDISALKLLFAHRKVAFAESQRLYQMHTHIHGERDGVKYDANDGFAQLWVGSCAFKGIGVAAELLGQPLSPDARQTIYERRIRPHLLSFGTPRPLIPETVEAFDSYREQMLSGEMLVQHKPSKELLDLIYVSFHSPKVPEPLAWAGRALTKSFTESRILDRAGVPFTDREQAFVDGFTWTIRHTYGQLPPTGIG